MTKLSRRHFLAGTSALGAAAGLFFNQTADAQSDAKKFFPNGFPKCKLGKTGIETTILGMGTGMTGGKPYYDMGEAAFIKLMHHGFDQGMRYIDTAQNYRTHVYVEHALRGWKREDFHILTKTPSRTEETVRSDVGRYLQELSTKYLDTLLLHCMTTADWPTRYAGAWNVLIDEKKKGRVRSIGVSCHSLDAVKACLDVPELDVLLVRINPFGVKYKMDDEPDKVVPVVKELHEKGVGILGMKIFGEGLCKTPEERRQSLEFIMGLGCVDTMTIGFTEVPQVDETLGMLSEILAKKST